eukprot:SAG22_NODE_3820_length_1515_cov_2.293079_1_plen_39_part_10
MGTTPAATAVARLRRAEAAAELQAAGAELQAAEAALREQ